jgi:hypothetical protein
VGLCEKSVEALALGFAADQHAHESSPEDCGIARISTDAVFSPAFVASQT